MLFLLYNILKRFTAVRHILEMRFKSLHQADFIENAFQFARQSPNTYPENKSKGSFITSFSQSFSGFSRKEIKCI